MKLKIMTKPIQKILFGSPGTGKSHRIVNDFLSNLGIQKDSEDHIATVFHPEYTYGDFMGKLMPLTVEEDKDNKTQSKVTYNFYAGHFLKALAQAYRNIIIAYLKEEAKSKNSSDENDESTDTDDVSEGNNVSLNSSDIQNVALVIDEINRGNSAAIFGTVFQLLDREQNSGEESFGWSSYSISISEMEFRKLLNLIGIKPKTHTSTNEEDEDAITTTKKSHEFKYRDEQRKQLTKSKTLKKWLDILRLEKNQIKLPPNLHILATMNTSDNSIYFMDSAFKRRWDWKFVNIDEDKDAEVLKNRNIVIDGLMPIKWIDFVDKLNAIFIENHKVIRKIEDKQIGYFFINEMEITEDHIKSKLMFFVWDSVFHTDKKPLLKLLGIENEKNLVTFGQFTKRENILKFINEINNR
jgi:5-methylcytosine-specific restriction protein B